MCVRYPEQRKCTEWHTQGETEVGKSNFTSALALADFSVTTILMALPLATTELPTCNYSLVIKTKNGVCQNRATPFWAADTSPSLAICSAALTSGKAAFLLLLVLVVSLWLLLFPSRPSPLPWSSCLFRSRLCPQQCHSSWAPGRTDVALVTSLVAQPASLHPLKFLVWDGWGQFGVKGGMLPTGQVWAKVGGWAVYSRGEMHLHLWGERSPHLKLVRWGWRVRWERTSEICREQTGNSPTSRNSGLWRIW